MQRQEKQDLLSRREWEIVHLVAKGYRNDDIAAELGTTANMVKNYLRVIFDKLGVWSRLELSLWYCKWQEEQRAKAKVNAVRSARAGGR